MTSPQFALLRSQLTELRARIQESERRMTTARSATEKADAELLTSFYRAAEQQAANEIELYSLTNGEIARLERACANPDRFVSKAPPPPTDILNWTPPRMVPPREQLIAWKRVGLESELRKAKARKSELERTGARWKRQELPEWERVTNISKGRLKGLNLGKGINKSQRATSAPSTRVGRSADPNVGARRTIVRDNLACPANALCKRFDADGISWSSDKGDFPGWVKGLRDRKYGSRIRTIIAKDKMAARRTAE